MTGFHHLFRYQTVGMTGFSLTRRVIMRENQRGCISLQRLTHNFSRVDDDAADGTSKHLLMANNPVLIV